MPRTRPPGMPRRPTIHFARLMESVASRLLGEPNAEQSRPPCDVRFGNHGSMSVDYQAGTFYDHENNVGGGVLDLIGIKLNCDHAGAMSWLEQQELIPAKKKSNGKSGEPIATYDYTDEAGNL